MITETTFIGRLQVRSSIPKHPSHRFWEHMEKCILTMHDVYHWGQRPTIYEVHVVALVLQKLDNV